MNPKTSCSLGACFVVVRGKGTEKSVEVIISPLAVSFSTRRTESERRDRNASRVYALSGFPFGGFVST